MAADVDVRMRVTADSSDAVKGLGKVGDGLDDVEKAAKRAQKASDGVVSGTGTGSNGGRVPVPNTAQTQDRGRTGEDKAAERARDAALASAAGIERAAKQTAVSAELARSAASGGGSGPPPPPDRGGRNDAIVSAWLRANGYQSRQEYAEKAEKILSGREAARAAAEEFARVAGRAIAKFIGGFAANELTSTAFSLMRQPGEDSRRIDQVEDTIKGTINWATAGAQIAGPIGAVVGGLMGGLNSFVLKEKEIADAIKKVNVEYRADRSNAEFSSRMRQEQAVFGSLLGTYRPEDQVKMLRERKDAMKGAGDGGAQYFQLYKALRTTAADEFYDMQSQFEDVLEAELKNSKTDRYGRALSIGGNAQGTRNYYDVLAQLAADKYGLENTKTKQMFSRRDAMDSQIDTIDDKITEIGLGEVERIKALARRPAITDSASSKGLGVGAQIGAMANDKAIDLLRDILNVMRSGRGDPASVVERLLSNGVIAKAVTS